MGPDLRARRSSPSWLLFNHDVEDGISERGKAKRRRLLNYLRDHPEELRTASPWCLPQVVRWVLHWYLARTQSRG